MLMKLRSRMQNQKGFTLVELMVVVVILGILVAIAVPVYNSVQARAVKNACVANLRTIDGMTTQWQLMDATEQAAITGGFAGMFTGGAIPACPGTGDDKGTYTNATATDNAKATCSKHGTY